jgi:hypothetical protein
VSGFEYVAQPIVVAVCAHMVENGLGFTAGGSNDSNNYSVRVLQRQSRSL